jgi:poly-beta-hydroxyalkanoate depolymerase
MQNPAPLRGRSLMSQYYATLLRKTVTSLMQTSTSIAYQRHS